MMSLETCLSLLPQYWDYRCMPQHTLNFTFSLGYITSFSFLSPDLHALSIRLLPPPCPSCQIDILFLLDYDCYTYIKYAEIYKYILLSLFWCLCVCGFRYVLCLWQAVGRLTGRGPSPFSLLQLSLVHTVFLSGGSPHEISPFHVILSINIVLAWVLYMQPLLGEIQMSILTYPHVSSRLHGKHRTSGATSPAPASHGLWLRTCHSMSRGQCILGCFQVNTRPAGRDVARP